MNPDPDPAIFAIDHQVADKKQILKKFFCLLLSFFKDKKSKKELQNSRNQGLSYYFCLMIVGSGSGSIPLTNGSGSGSRRPKNIRIRRIRIQIRIRNTAVNRNIHMRDKIASDKINTKNLGRWLGLEILPTKCYFYAATLNRKSF